MEVNQWKAVKVAPNHSMDKILQKILDGETVRLARAFTEPMRLGADLTEASDGKKTTSRKKCSQSLNAPVTNGLRVVLFRCWSFGFLWRQGSGSWKGEL